MAVDYEEGRRLLRGVEAGQTLADWGAEIAAEDALKKWLRTHAEALLNPDPWRPIEELPEEWKDGRPILMRTRTGKYRVVKWGLNHMSVFSWCGPDRTYSEAYFTHFRELKGPGQ